MPKEQEDFQRTVEHMLDVVIFEHWLRFYFVQEMVDEKDLDQHPRVFLLIPEKSMQKIKEVYPEYLSLAEFMNKRELSFELSQQAICTYVVENIDGKEIPRDMAPSIIDSISFQSQLQLFDTWLSLHEEQLEQGFLLFGTWKELFTEFCASKAGKELREKIFLSHTQAPKTEA